MSNKDNENTGDDTAIGTLLGPDGTPMTTDKLQQMVQDYRQGLPPMPVFRGGYITCTDGFTMSVQASSGSYCAPRDNRGPYFEVEIGYPSKKEELIWDYMEGPSWYYEDENGDYQEYTDEEYEEAKVRKCTDTVYPFVPVSVVRAVIKKHGGIASGTLPPLV